MIAFLLICHMVLTPLVMCSKIENKFLSTLLTFVPICGMATLNFIAVELENPFGTDDNDLPMNHFQEEMNSCLLMLLHPNTDMITCTSPECVLDFDDLLASMDGHRSAGTMVRLSTVSHSTSEKNHEGVDIEAKKTEEPAAALPLQVMHPAQSSASLALRAQSSASIRAQSSASLTQSSTLRNQVHTESIKDHSAKKDEAVEDKQQALINKGIDVFEASFKQWTQSVQAQVTQLNESFNALKTFNETTSQMILETHWPNPENSVQSECGGWQIAISPI
jgi:hypothetical protein